MGQCAFQVFTFDTALGLEYLVHAISVPYAIFRYISPPWLTHYDFTRCRVTLATPPLRRISWPSLRGIAVGRPQRHYGLERQLTHSRLIS